MQASSLSLSMPSSTCSEYRSPVIGFQTSVARWFIFKPKTSKFGEILEGLIIENVRIFYGHLQFFRAIRHISNVMVIYMVYFSPFWYIVLRKIWQPGSRQKHEFSRIVSKRNETKVSKRKRPDVKSIDN
jgi:hypothetical protein